MKKSLLFVIATVLWTGSPAQVYRAYLDEQGATKIVLMEGSHRFQRFML